MAPTLRNPVPSPQPTAVNDTALWGTPAAAATSESRADAAGLVENVVGSAPSTQPPRSERTAAVLALGNGRGVKLRVGGGVTLTAGDDVDTGDSVTADVGVAAGVRLRAGVPDTEAVPDCAGLDDTDAVGVLSGVPATVLAGVGVPSGVPVGAGVPEAAGVPVGAGVPEAAGVPVGAGVPATAGVPDDVVVLDGVVVPVGEGVCVNGVQGQRRTEDT